MASCQYVNLQYATRSGVLGNVREADLQRHCYTILERRMQAMPKCMLDRPLDRPAPELRPRGGRNGHGDCWTADVRQSSRLIAFGGRYLWEFWELLADITAAFAIYSTSVVHTLQIAEFLILSFCARSSRDCLDSASWLR